MSRGRSIDAALMELAAPTLGIVHEQALRDAGISADTVRRRMEDGWIARVVGRTLAVGPQCASPTFEMRCMAGALAAGPNGRVDGVTAATVIGAWNRRCDVVHVSSPDGTVPARIGAYRFSRVRGLWLPERALEAEPIPLVDPFRMLATMSVGFTEWQVAFVLDRLVYERIVTVDEVDEVARARSRAPGNATLRSAVELARVGSVGTRGWTEDEFLRCFLESGAPVPLVNVRGAMGMSRDEPDFAWPGTRTNIECDGGHHDEPRQRKDDIERDEQARALGWRVLRVRTQDHRRRRGYVRGMMRRFLGGESVPTIPGTAILLVP